MKCSLKYRLPKTLRWKITKVTLLQNEDYQSGHLCTCKLHNATRVSQKVLWCRIVGLSFTCFALNVYGECLSLSHSGHIFKQYCWSSIYKLEFLMCPIPYPTFGRMSLNPMLLFHIFINFHLCFMVVMAKAYSFVALAILHCAGI